MDPAEDRDGPERRGQRRDHWVWPVAITVGLLLVVLVNVGFIVVAVTGADEVVESYNTEER